MPCNFIIYEIFKFIRSVSFSYSSESHVLSKFNLVALTVFSHYSQPVSESSYDISPDMYIIKMSLLWLDPENITYNLWIVHNVITMRVVETIILIENPNYAPCKEQKMFLCSGQQSTLHTSPLAHQVCAIILPFPQWYLNYLNKLSMVFYLLNCTKYFYKYLQS